MQTTGLLIYCAAHFANMFMRVFNTSRIRIDFWVVGEAAIAADLIAV